MIEARRHGALERAGQQIDIDRLVGRVVDSCVSAAFPAHAHDQAFRSALMTSVAHNVIGLRSVLLDECSVENLDLSPILAFASVQATLGIPQMHLQHSYRVSFSVQWHTWADALERQMTTGTVEAADAFHALHAMTRVVTTYYDYVASQVAATHTRDRETLDRSRAHIRHTLIKTILNGHEEELSSADRTVLSYPVEQFHLVLMTTLTDDGVLAVLPRLLTAVHVRDYLTMPLGLSGHVIWLARPQPWRAVHLDRLAVELDGVAGAVLAHGAAGSDGFRAAFDRAQSTEQVRQAWLRHGVENQPAVMRYDDVRLDVLLMQDRRLGRAFVAEELSGLAADTAEAARLRGTLEASFRYGSHVAAANHLKLHEHTVRNRLQRAEELIGHDLLQRRTELQVALRLRRLFRVDPVDEPQA